ncbi:hypothetical protein F4775DRAFT_572719 [Biscogniauxia sp. FL1348]|nr:hypothetical protein F4775DRAFT_572719 [Biscogniauxia sp. FL1348]
MSLMRKNIVSCELRQQIDTLNRLQRFTYYHFNLLRSGISVARSEYLWIQTFYLILIEDSLTSVRESMHTVNLRNLKKSTFEEIMMVDPFVRRPDPNPVQGKSESTEDRTGDGTQEINSPGENDAKVEKDPEIEQDARREEDGKPEQPGIMKMTNTSIPDTELNSSNLPYAPYYLIQSNDTPASDIDTLLDNIQQQIETLSDEDGWFFELKLLAESDLFWPDGLEEEIYEKEPIAIHISVPFRRHVPSRGDRTATRSRK